MYVGKLVFAQVMEHLPLHTFRRIVTRYAGERKIQSFSCLDQFLSMAFAQLSFRESLREIEACLRAQHTGQCERRSDHLGPVSETGSRPRNRAKFVKMRW